MRNFVTSLLIALATAAALAVTDAIAQETYPDHLCEADGSCSDLHGCDTCEPGVLECCVRCTNTVNPHYRCAPTVASFTCHRTYTNDCGTKEIGNCYYGETSCNWSSVTGGGPCGGRMDCYYTYNG